MLYRRFEKQPMLPTRRRGRDYASLSRERLIAEVCRRKGSNQPKVKNAPGGAGASLESTD